MNSSLTVSAGSPLIGTARVPGDKSISHRAVMLGGLAVGTTQIEGLLEGEDVLATAAAFRQLGADVTRHQDGAWTVTGVGLGGLREPEDILDMGNSGTAARLLLGILAGHPIRCMMTGDASLRSRPMGRVTDPLTAMGARIETRDGGRLPLMIQGADMVLPITYELPVPSAQVKSAVLLAGLMARGETAVIESVATRDHTERMLTHFGGKVSREALADGGSRIAVTGEPELTAADILVPADPSSAAFPLVAALLVPGSEVHLPNIGMNPTRIGLIKTLLEMGADIVVENERVAGGEPVADLIARHSTLHGVDVPPERAASMIDEYPILCIAASQAEGTTRMQGVSELRVKESDRIAVMATGLRANGVTVTAGEDWMQVEGRPGDVAGGARVATHLDHRIAMSFFVLGLVTKKPVTIDDAAPIRTSFPNFLDLMAALESRRQG
ncbi:MAG: 3-phosphoshikimate 1-carboxyvinyltransferase [Rhodospirillaceae bacterium]|nr:3-phosphoshikimate 1-carboxyvinyltransferase [Rhodospirillaceae bacterium]MAX63880.1 3-phosphoshikimate 1-carboxyvinyltransferase [Rhodospirillaceae bacterium]MBB57314.1 3-phosphoshikimate 1-carboxyvinyltransferase [Rhodospirillaceae bacterium]|tara:strand:- start:42196 stop:43521 length:1326 start_codon:yes stop_codon:yes gene_type:complete